jgi:hypothetical protein
MAYQNKSSAKLHYIKRTIVMLDDVQKVDLTRQDLEMIEGALATQEKILAVQSRAGGRAARNRLNELKGLMRRLRRQIPEEAETTKGEGWTRFNWSFF